MHKEIKRKLKKSFIYDIYLCYRRLINKKMIQKDPRIFIEFEYRRLCGRNVNIDNPRTYTEKLQWIKLYGITEDMEICADKVKVREYIRKILGEDAENYFPKWYGIYRSFKEIDFEKLPKQFVLKSNHASGHIIICKDKENVDMRQIQKKTKRWLQENFYYVSAEPQYKNITPYLICEELLEDNIIDYRIFCFSGRPYIIKATQHNKDALIGSDERTYFCDWSQTGIIWNREYGKKNFLKPRHLDEMLKLAATLSAKFLFVRVDLYETNQKIYFSEMTFTPNSGFEKDLLYDWDLKLGDRLMLADTL